jgi:hypothetical protein
MATVLSGCELVASAEPSSLAVSTLKNATFAVLRADLAQRVLDAFYADLKRGRQEQNLRIDRLGWAIRHLDAVIRRGQTYTEQSDGSMPKGGGLWGDVGSIGDVEL